MGRITADKHDDSLNALVRPGSLDVTGQQPELFPFDAFSFQTYNGKDGNPKVTLKEDWILDPKAIQSYSLSIQQITAAGDTTKIDGGTDLTAGDTVYDGGETTTLAAERVYNDNSDENNIEGISDETIVMDSPVFFKEGIAGSVRSLNFESGVQGWQIQKTGDVEFNDGTFRGNLDAAGGSFSGTLDAATGSFAGDLVAYDATFYGWIDSAGLVTRESSETTTSSNSWVEATKQAYYAYGWIINTLGREENLVYECSGSYAGNSIGKVMAEYYEFTGAFGMLYKNWKLTVWRIDGSTSSLRSTYKEQEGIWDTDNSYSYGDLDITFTIGGNVVKLVDLPTSSTGLEVGQLYADGTGKVYIVL